MQMPSPAPTATAPVYATPAPAPDDYPVSNRGPRGLLVPAAQSPTPLPEASAALGPGQARVSADRVYGSLAAGGTLTAAGNVVLRSGDINVMSDQAVYDDSTKIVRSTGHVRFLTSTGDSATADALEYDANNDRVTMLGVHGASSALAYQGQPIRGALSYSGRRVRVDKAGHTLIDEGWVTTCDLRHVAYHITGRQIEIRPGDRLIVHHSALHVGKLVAAALGVLVIPLSAAAERRPTAFAPRVGYNSTQGVFVRNYINFYHGPNYYGTYHVDYYQKVGLGLGADVYFARRDNRGSGQLSFYQLRNNARQRALSGQQSTTQASVSLQQLLSKSVRAALFFTYAGATGVFTSIPAQTTANLNVTHTGARSTTNYAATVSRSGPSISAAGFFNHNIALTSRLNQQVSLSLQENSTPFAFSRAVSLNTDTHYTGRLFDSDLVIATNHGRQTTRDFLSGHELQTDTIALQRVPELTLRARPFELHRFHLPVLFTLVGGEYNDGYDAIKTARYDATLQLGSALYRLGHSSDLSASATVRQDIYGTGDMRGSIAEQLQLHSFFGRHADNTLAYQDMSVRGYTPMPSLDSISGFDQISELFNFYNGSIYRFTASTAYNFRSKFLSSIFYQLNVQPSPYASLSLGTTYDPHGSGYSPLSIALATPLTRNDYFQFAGSFDFKLHGLQGQNYFLSHTVNDCYQIRLSYRQPLKQVDLSLSLLAFPGQSVNFGINRSGPIIPQNLSL